MLFRSQEKTGDAQVVIGKMPVIYVNALIVNII